MAMSIYTHAVAGLMVWLVTGCATKECLIQEIAYNTLNCLSISTNDLTTASDEIFLSSYCKDIECNMKCYDDAIGDCYQQDAFFVFNPDVLKATNRILCDNPSKTIAALLNCNWTDTACLPNMKTTIAAAHEEFKNINYTGYKSQYCSALLTAYNCIGFTETASCPAAYVSFAENFYKAAYSYTTCGIPAHAYLNKYGGDVTCGGCNLNSSFSAVLAILSLYVFGQ